MSTSARITSLATFLVLALVSAPTAADVQVDEPLQPFRTVDAEGDPLAEGLRFGADIAVAEPFVFVGAPDAERPYAERLRELGGVYRPWGGLDFDGRDVDGAYGEVVASDGTWTAVGAPDVRLLEIGGAQDGLEKHFRDTGRKDDDRFAAEIGVVGGDVAVSARQRGKPVVRLYGRKRPGRWRVVQTLREGDAPDGFGLQISGAGDVLVVGAPADSGGSVFVYTRGAKRWSLAQRIDAPAGASRFPTALACDGETLVVGAADEDAVWVAERSGEGFDDLSVLPGPATRFGASAAVADDVLVVGTGVSEAFVYRRGDTGWDLRHRVTDPEGAGTAGFGSVVAATRDKAYFAAPLATGGGQVYALPLRRVVAAPDTPPALGFGATVALHADVAVVGAPGTPLGNVNGAGLAYVLRREGGSWRHEATLDLDERFPSKGEFLGTAVAASRDLAVVTTTYGTEVDGSRAGTVEIWTRGPGGWTHAQTVVPAAHSAGRDFGDSVATDGATLVVGAPRDDTGAQNAGVVHVFERGPSGFVETQTIPAPSPQGGEEFGRSVAVAGDYMLIGAPGEESFDLGGGTAFLYVRVDGTWEFADTAYNAPGNRLERFGTHVALSGRRALVGGEPVAGAPAGDRGGVVVMFRTGDRLSRGGTLVRVPGADTSSSYGVMESGTIAVAGTGDGGEGVVGVFRDEGSTVVLERTVRAAEPADRDAFGAGIGVSCGNVLIGAPADPDGGGVHALSGVGFDDRSVRVERDAPRDLVVGEPVLHRLRLAQGLAPVTFDEADELPPGLSFDAATGTLSGAPTEPGSFRVSVRLRDACGREGSFFDFVQVRPPVGVPADLVATGVLGRDFQQFLYSDTGFRGATIELVSGTLAPGLDVRDGNVLFGRPTQEGVFTARFRATDRNGATAEADVVQVCVPVSDVSSGRLTETIDFGAGAPPRTDRVVELLGGSRLDVTVTFSGGDPGASIDVLDRGNDSLLDDEDSGARVRVGRRKATVRKLVVEDTERYVLRFDVDPAFTGRARLEARVSPLRKLDRRRQDDLYLYPSGEQRLRFGVVDGATLFVKANAQRVRSFPGEEERFPAVPVITRILTADGTDVFEPEALRRTKRGFVYRSRNPLPTTDLRVYLSSEGDGNEGPVDVLVKVRSGRDGAYGLPLPELVHGNGSRWDPDDDR